MRDPEWTDLVARFCVEQDVTDRWRISRLAERDDYQLARREFEYGAPCGVVRRLLERALAEVS